MTFHEWFNNQLVKNQIRKSDLCKVTGVGASTIKAGNIRDYTLKMPTIIVLCEGIVILKGGSLDDFITLVQEALETIPEYQYAINRLEKKQ